MDVSVVSLLGTKQKPEGALTKFRYKVDVSVVSLLGTKQKPEGVLTKFTYKVDVSVVSILTRTGSSLKCKAVKI